MSPLDDVVSPSGWMLWRLTGAALAVIVITSVTIVAADFYRHWQKRRSVGQIPLIHDGSWLSPSLQWRRPSFDAESEMARAYKKYSKNGKPFAWKTQNGLDIVIIIPPECGKEYYSLPREKCSFMHWVRNEMFLNTVVDVTWRVPVEAVQISSQSAPMERLGRVIFDHLDRVLPLFLPGPGDDEWRQVNGSDMMNSFVRDLALCLFFNPGFGEEGGLRRQMSAYMDGLADQWFARQESPFILEHLVWRLSPRCRKFQSTIQTIRQIVVPEVRRRIQQIRSNDKDSCFLLSDLLIKQALKRGTLCREGKTGEQETIEELIVDEIMFMYMETVAPFHLVATCMVFRIMRHPEYVAPLREELERALELCGGEWSFEIFNHTPKMESFTREILRLHNPTSISGARCVMEPITIPSLGLALERGTHISLPSRFIHTDPENYPDPMTFNGYRFYDEASGTCNVQKTLAPSEAWLPFGIGTSACPARLVGTRTCQALFAKILMDYDVGQMEDKDVPLQIWLLGIYVPSPTISVSVRRRDARRTTEALGTKLKPEE
ncbi:cytochrome P450 [Aspergillus candidus]|uniref:Cytochrome P450 n=1 Tax=Aspergillus candidus TaxID=41067 RepID=A0A2I2FAK0_ASPCN|nr:cytochrome P450 [Aspergillus candidus]PLB37644.1 cytochrome P450 [Aspergillus candidus]